MKITYYRHESVSKYMKHGRLELGKESNFMYIKLTEKCKS